MAKSVIEMAYEKYPIVYESRHEMIDESCTRGYSVDINKEKREIYINAIEEYKKIT
jgi:hypothetical protein